jgi:hypothetical protein
MEKKTTVVILVADEHRLATIKDVQRGSVSSIPIIPDWRRPHPALKLASEGVRGKRNDIERAHDV